MCSLTLYRLSLILFMLAALSLGKLHGCANSICRLITYVSHVLPRLNLYSTYHCFILGCAAVNIGIVYIASSRQNKLNVPLQTNRA